MPFTPVVVVNTYLIRKLHHINRMIEMKKGENHILNTEANFITYASESERLRKDVFRSDMDKLRLFTKMLRRNSLLKKAKISHK